MVTNAARKPADPAVATGTTAITDAVVVLPETVVERGTVVIRDGRIAEVIAWPAPAALDLDQAERVIDARGAYLVPGVVDLHNDSLETEINPRPETNLPIEFALASLERRLIAWGVTTEFHAIGFMNMASSNRSLQQAADRAAYVARLQQSGDSVVQHHVLHRLDVWFPDAMELLFESAARCAIPYLSLNDHTPGQGQYRDLERHIETMRAWRAQRGGGPLDVGEVRRRMAERAADTESVPAVYARVQAEAARLPLVIATHDDDSVEKVDCQWEIGARIAEFPVTIEAAQRARERGMAIVVGAPNIVRGGSSSGNLDARELWSLGLADVICADYHAPSLLAAAFRLVDEGLAELPAAVRALTLNPARALGLRQTGAIVPGFRADLLLVERRTDGIPHVGTVVRDGRAAYTLSGSVTPASGGA